MKEGETVNEYILRTLAIANRMTAHGERLEQTMIVEKVLRSMTPRFNYVVCSIGQSNDVTTLSIDELQSSLLVHEQRMQSQVIKDEEQALKVSGRGNGRGRGARSGSRGRGRGRQGKKLLNSNVTNWAIIRVNVLVGEMQTMLHLMIVKKCFSWHNIKIQFKPKMRYGFWTLDVAIIW
jgi:hypothetical protein